MINIWDLILPRPRVRNHDSYVLDYVQDELESNLEGAFESTQSTPPPGASGYLEWLEAQPKVFVQCLTDLTEAQTKINLTHYYAQVIRKLRSP